MDFWMESGSFKIEPWTGTAGRRVDVGAFTIIIRPRSGPEAQFPARSHYCVTRILISAEGSLWILGFGILSKQNP